MLDLFDRFNAQVREHCRAQSQAVALDRKIRRRNKRSNWTGDRQTLSEIGRLVHLRHAGPCDTDDGEVYLRAVLPCVVAKAGGFEADDLDRQVIEWARVIAPRIGLDTIRACLVEANERDTRKCLWWSAQELGDLLRLTAGEREQLNLTRIRPAGMTGQQFAKYQKKREAERAKARRAAKGARPQEQSKAQLKPWDALGMSRPTYFRRQKAGTLPAQIRDRETVSSAAGTKYLQITTRQSHATERTAPDPARHASPICSVGAVGHAPGAKARAVPPGRARARPLPVDGVSEHPDMFGGGEWKQLGAPLTDYGGGVLPVELVRVIRDAQRVRHMTQEAVAHQIGISRPQLANALQGRYGLSRSAAVNLLQWLAA